MTMPDRDKRFVRLSQVVAVVFALSAAVAVLSERTFEWSTPESFLPSEVITFGPTETRSDDDAKPWLHTDAADYLREEAKKAAVLAKKGDGRKDLYLWLADANPVAAVQLDRLHGTGVAFRALLALLGLASAALVVRLGRRWRVRMVVAAGSCLVSIAALLVLKSHAQDVVDQWHEPSLGFADVGLTLVIVWGATAAFSTLVLVVRRK